MQNHVQPRSLTENKSYFLRKYVFRAIQKYGADGTQNTDYLFDPSIRNMHSLKETTDDKYKQTI